ncbi:MAG: tRNA (adenosine(37)-N6)-threonylcarbamoyltransferase complex dimerization subunit type 1 TsaB [Desulfobacterales bacterium]|nr:tRNA (adenosine(37)-N6)-threonylcarbamoyltransferase complex dimerization subunit type 1 TsaB [Desulfobacterales bacterium]
MKILAVDTATKSCSVAIVEKESIIAEITLSIKQTHSKHLMEMIDTVLNMSGLTVSELDGFAVTRGPGSFTGLRIGISSIKGFAMASGKPIVGVSSLDSLAMQCCFSSYLVSPLLDARKGEVYFSRYRFENGHLKKEVREQAITPVEAVCDINEPCLFVGDAVKNYQNKIKDEIGDLAHFAPPYQNTIRASTVGHLSLAKFEINDTDDNSLFTPYYIRKSLAELSLDL